MQKTKTFKDLGVELYIHEDNRLPIYYFKKENWPLSIYFQFDCGAVKDTKHGISHFLEHLIVSGTKKYPKKEILADVFAQRGSTRNAFTNKLTLAVALYLTDIEDLEFAGEILDEYVFNSIFDPVTFEKKTAVLDEIRRSESNFDRLVANELFSKLYAGSELSHSVLGTVETVSSITRDDLIAHYKDVLNHSKQSLIISGDVSPESLTPLADSLKGKIPEEQAVIEKFIAVNQVNAVTRMEQKTSGVFVGYNTTSFDDAKYNALFSFLSWKLFSQSGLLIKRLRYDLGLTYAVRDVGMASKINGFDGAFISCAKDKLEITRDETIKIYEEIIFDFINKEEIAKYLHFASRMRKRSYETGLAWLDRSMYKLLHYGKDAQFFDDHAKILLETPIEELKNIAKKYFKPENRSVVLFEGQNN